MRYHTLLVVLLLLAGCTVKEENQEEITTLTFNIEDPNKNFPAYWEKYKHTLLAPLRDTDADFIGLQEVTPSQIVYLGQAVDEYGYIFRTHEAAPSKGEGSPILYKRDKWELLKSGTIWLSDKPDVAGSATYGNSRPRAYTWGCFRKIGTTKMVNVYNAYLDDMSEHSRLESTKQIVREMMERGHHPVVLMGDFNASHLEKSIQYITQNSFVSLEDPFTDKDLSLEEGSVSSTQPYTFRDDYIFVSKGTQVLDVKMGEEITKDVILSNNSPLYVRMKI